MTDFIGDAGWNSAGEYCKELRAISINMHNKRVVKNYSEWYDWICAYFMALSPRIQRNKKKNMFIKHLEYYEKAKKAMKEYNNAITNKQTHISLDLYDLLFEWELELRKVEDDLGLLMMNKGDPGTAVSAGMF